MDDGPIALILAAGMGTRMKSSRVKVLHEVAGRPLIHWVLDAAFESGVEDVVVVVGHQREAVEESIRDRYPERRITIAEQEKQLGTGDAARAGISVLDAVTDDRMVVILSGDAPLLGAARIRSLLAVAENCESKMALVATHCDEHIRYGRLIREDGTLKKIVEFTDASESQREITEMNGGFYAIPLSELRKGLGLLEDTNAQGEFYLTDLVEQASTRGGAEVVMVSFEEVSGVNTRQDLAFVERCAREKINQRWMSEGVTLQCPEQVFIDADVGPIGSDVRIAQGVHLRGRTKVGSGTFIDTGAVLHNVEIAENCHIKPYSVVTDSMMGAEVQVGPFTHCRPNTKIDDRAKVGNFVETKKAHLMTGAKANHLAYLGDASIGAGANIGAGTITCNYDGISKHKTIVEAGAFIGSDSQLVAPVKVGRDAYVGSGTTVTKDVPRSGLALSRVKQVNVEGWADRFRTVQEKRKKAKELRESKKTDPKG